MGETPAERASRENDGRPKAKFVQVTGSLIPQRVKVKSIGTATQSNVRVIDRKEIDATGRYTARDILARTDPSVQIIGH